MGDIPEAPGLPDLDALYPELEEPEPVLLPLPLPELPPLPPLPAEPPTLIEKPKKKRGRKLKLLILSTILIGSGLGIAHYLGYIDIKEYYDILLDFFN